jgi:ABC-type lipopolysaccharide export system ATPase subunit
LVNEKNAGATLDRSDRTHINGQGGELMRGTAEAAVVDGKVRRVYLGDAFSR